MNRRIFLLALFLLAGSAASVLQAASIGTWKAYMAYNDVKWVERGGNTLYVLASDNLYSYNENDQSILTFDKAKNLNDCGINYIGWNDKAKRLVIVYASYNIDLLDHNGNVTNIGDYAAKSMTANKTINSIDMDGAYCYLSTGFGIIKLNVADAEISDTYNLGFNVDYSYREGNYVYAASSTNGLYRGLVTANLLDKANWERTGEYVPRTKTTDPELLATVSNLMPGGPKYNYFGFMRFQNNKLYTCGGGWNTNDLMRAGTVQVLSGDDWQIYQDDIAARTGYNYVDLGSLDIDPGDPNHVFVAGRTGVYEFQNGTFVKAYSNDNTNGCLRTAATVGNDNKNYVICNTVKFDTKGSLWTFNSISPTTSLIEYTKDKQWTSHHSETLMYDPSRSLENVVGMFFDSQGLLWFCNKHYRTPSVFAYQPSTNGILAYKSFTNEDGTELSPAGGVSCIAEDLDHNIWLGTTIGPLRLTRAEMTNESPVFEQVKVPRNDGTNLADYLLDNINITCMAIDGGGRKWFGTAGNGVYLISEDNMTQIQHFISADSPLLSNNIESIAINDATGEVFFGTDKGLCSYMSDATQTVDEMNTDVTYAYPNPVRPGYTGPITIVGLTLDADVKIVTTSGTLVAKGRSNGGSFVWDGNDLDGKRVASGVYMVETAQADGSSGTVCKIAVVN